MFKFPIALITILLALSSFSAQAQMSDRVKEHPGPLKYSAPNAENVTRDMANRLHLNEGQYLKLLPLNRIKLSGLNSINHQYKNDETTRAAKAAELEAQFEQECSRILTPSQLSQLQLENGQPSTAPASSGNGLG
ncbi:MAG: hypothetical protein JWR44_3684 [Hymenobacter sp.]|jgi:Spy/CpxP family protein refolding chaperone|nr:hypothetical protein [Hymenobacter sp.]